MRSLVGAAACLLAAALLAPAAAQPKYGPGVSDSEIRVGQTQPLSGPASAYGTQGRIATAFWKMANEKGGVNGRKVAMIVLDDAYSPPKTVEQTRRLVENDHVLAVVNSVGTPTNTAVHKYMNLKKVPQLLISTGASKWNDPVNFPWTTSFYPSYEMEAQVYARYLLQNQPDAKVAILYQNDDMGKDYVHGFKAGLGDKAKAMIVAEASYEVTDPTVDSQVISLKASGATVFFNIATPKFAAQAIRKTYDLGWKPVHLLASVSSSIGAVLQPVGPEKAVGLITAMSYKTPGDPTWDNDAGMKAYLDFMKAYYPDGQPADTSNIFGYSANQLLLELLRRCGSELTRENLMKQATNLSGMQMPMLLPGVTVTTTPKDFNPFRKLQLARFDGTSWNLFGSIISAQ
ncbi:ABC transporter substrate-binding protein [Vineibacter terrae]|uniref:ABC transporter substrate-binding protein n=1 Tax=Vineibacter terrae TaxID=2586908 RepID=A0A5C8P9U9_9HYPH|nr:ABC transporter substrate-binding protein [Vineibacter terrae]TXL70575.1 ABC transporter substrate-binding protein [Vineibacter terrae]